LGAISFSIYAFHWPVMDFLFRQWMQSHRHSVSKLDDINKAVTLVLVVVPTATLVHLMVERPSRAWLKARLHAWAKASGDDSGILAPTQAVPVGQSDPPRPGSPSLTAELGANHRGAASTLRPVENDVTETISLSAESHLRRTAKD
jgi:hypothetical protein